MPWVWIAEVKRRHRPTCCQMCDHFSCPVTEYLDREAAFISRRWPQTGGHLLIAQCKQYALRDDGR